MKKLMILSAIFLSACGGKGAPGELRDVERCSIIIQKVYDEKRIRARCICQDYEFTLDHTGPVGKERRVNIERCHKLVGFSPDEWGGLTVWAKDLFEWARNKLRK